ncbi:MAG: trypsin-like peptidase domain-containing protein [Planctomycetes bacterium]|nr:trypsin-like peptidase domain-containing protein [Planctomycetota bacterium]
MIRKNFFRLSACVLLVGLTAMAGRAQESMTKTAVNVNKKMVKLFGIGGFKGLPSYGTGILVSEKGHILTVNNHILINPGILVHVYDGRRYQARVIAREPALDAAILEIDEEVVALPHYDFDQETARPTAENGDWILAMSNQFKIGVGDEPMSVQRGVIAAAADLRGRRGVFDAPYAGDVYFLDVIACNPGAAGGALVNRKGHLLGLLGRELKDTRIDTWINYAVPVQATAEVSREGKIEKVSLADFVKLGIQKKYKEGDKAIRVDKGGFHGITLVVKAVSSVPPYVEEVMLGSPADKAGLRPDDLILYVEGFSVPTITSFLDVMKQYGPGSDVDLQYQRGNKLEKVRLKLTDPPKVPAAN